MGLTTAKAFAEAGAAVVLADVNEAPVAVAADELTRAATASLSNGPVRPSPDDVGTPRN